MKIRNSFISNSSSSSFILRKDKLSPEQIKLIIDHKFCGEKYADTDFWRIEEDDIIIKGSTLMDNFDFLQYLKKIGIKKEDFIHIDGNNYFGEEDEN